MFVYKRRNLLPVKSWIPREAYYADEGMVTQVENLAALPFAHHHIAQMADGHFGFGMPIGCVLASRGVVIPNAVGVDIGCGMAAVRTSLPEIGRDDLQAIVDQIKQVVPAGFGKHESPIEEPPALQRFDKGPVASEQRENAMRSLGTLGGGNHFIEIQAGSDGRVWVMLHSGSRNLGLKVAKHYNKLAIELNERWYSSVNRKSDLAFLPVATEAGRAYIHEMLYCVAYASENRKLLLSRIQQVFEQVLGDVEFDQSLDIAHNYAALEQHFGADVWVHRKGATRARKGEMGIIPGSMGTASYIVTGLGNAASFMSCSHGAGRRMGRKQAIKQLDLAEERAKLAGVINDVTQQVDLDEAPGAYKDIDEVMRNQVDLVRAGVKLQPLASVKG